MPELIEAEQYRAALDGIVGRRIVDVEVDPSYVRGGLGAGVVAAALHGATVTATRRHGKVVVAALVGGGADDLGLRFGMTGRLVVGSVVPIERLEYGSGRDDPAWDRFAMRCDDGTAVRLNDSRRLGSVELDPDLSRLGPDATVVGIDELTSALRSSRAVKAVLLDQHAVAGLGNLLTDETLWRARIDPARPAVTLAAGEVAELRRAIRRTLGVLSRRGGSHTGDLQSERSPGGRCPRDGEALTRRTVGGRTTYSCPACQPGGST